MKLAFSTLGCPKWGADQILQAARESGYAGVELRFYEGSMDLPTVIGARPGGAEGLAQRFAAANLALTAPSSSPSRRPMSRTGRRSSTWRWR